MKYLIIAFAILFLSLIETSIFGELEFMPVVPYLVVVFCSVLVILEERKFAIFGIIFSGILLDFLSGLPDGIFLLSLSFACFVSFVLVYWWLAREYSTVILFAAVGATTLVFFTTSLLLTKLFSLIGLGVGTDYGYLLINKLIWHVIFNLVFAYPILLYFHFVTNLNTKTFFRKTN